MMRHTHLFSALFLYLLALEFMNIDFSFPLALILCIGAIFPDVDLWNSTINKRFKLTRVFALFTEHRGFFHSLFGILLFLIIGVVITYFTKISINYTMFFCLGYFLHLATDSMTPMGVKWFWLSKRGHVKGIIKTGSLLENLFFLIVFILTIYLFVRLPEFQRITAFMAKLKP